MLHHDRVTVNAGVRKFGKAVGDLIVPRECGGCRVTGTSWCDACRRACALDFRRIPSQTHSTVPLFAGGRYRGPLRNTILAAKAGGCRDMADPMGHMLAELLLELERRKIVSFAQGVRIVPAPFRPRSARLRGGDPVLRMARSAGRYLPHVTVEDILRYPSGVKDSVGLAASERQENVKGAAYAHRNPHYFQGHTTVVVDDVITTGATMREAVRALSCLHIPVSCAVALAG